MKTETHRTAPPFCSHNEIGLEEENFVRSKNVNHLGVTFY
jgi:hypothetical protein